MRQITRKCNLSPWHHTGSLSLLKSGSTGYLFPNSLSNNMKRDHFCVDCRAINERSTKRRQIPSVTSAPNTVEDGTSGNRVEEKDNSNVLKPHDNQGNENFEVDRISLAYSLCETEREQEKESGSLLPHQGPTPRGQYVLWSVDSSQDEKSIKNIQILASIQSNHGNIDDIASPFEDPEILALLPKSSGSTSCDASMDECILSSDEHRLICPHPSFRPCNSRDESQGSL